MSATEQFSIGAIMVLIVLQIFNWLYHKPLTKTVVDRRTNGQHSLGTINVFKNE